MIMSPTKKHEDTGRPTHLAVTTAIEAVDCVCQRRETN